jgi:hypothetical protein
MANIIDMLTWGHQTLLVVDASPGAGGGTAAEVGSIATWDNAGSGQLYLKTGAADTAWTQISTITLSGIVNNGEINRLAVYSTTGPANTLDDQLTFSGFLLDVIVGSHTLTANRTYTIPDVGANASFVMTEGIQTINGNKTFGNNVVIAGNLTVNGTLTWINTTNLEVTDKLIRLNKNGAANSGHDSGFEIEENNIVTAYFKTENSTPTSDAWALKAPDSEELTFDLSALTVNRTITFQNRNGYVALQTAAALTQGSVTFIDSNLRLAEDNANFFWDSTNNRLGIGTNAPAVSLHVAGSTRISGSGSTIRHLADADFEMRQATVNTTDATLTTAQTIAIPTNSAVMITAHIVGRRTGGTAGNPQDSAVYIRTARFKNVAGTVTIHNLQSDYTSEDVNQWNATLQVSGTNALVLVQGQTNYNVTWEVHTHIMIVD